MPLIPLGLFTDVEKDGACASSFGGRSSVELLDAPSLLPTRRNRRRVAPNVVVADDGELLTKTLGLFGIRREDDDRRPERNSGAHPDRE